MCKAQFMNSGANDKVAALCKCGHTVQDYIKTDENGIIHTKCCSCGEQNAYNDEEV